MQTVKMSLRDDDSVIQCQTNVRLNDTDKADLFQFLKQIRHELVIGQSASLEIMHPSDETFTLTVSYTE